jgi:hypothetical protein
MTPVRAFAARAILVAYTSSIRAVDENPFAKQGKLLVAKSGTHLEDAIHWFNPRSGKWNDKKPKGLFAPPDGDDWILVVKP